VVTHLGERFTTPSSSSSTSPLDNSSRILSCGTEDVLTCHVIVLHHSFTQVTALAHFDEFVRERGVENFVK
jgi:hypothetical protein